MFRILSNLFPWLSNLPPKVQAYHIDLISKCGKLSDKQVVEKLAEFMALEAICKHLKNGGEITLEGNNINLNQITSKLNDHLLIQALHKVCDTAEGYRPRSDTKITIENDNDLRVKRVVVTKKNHY